MKKLLSVCKRIVLLPHPSHDYLTTMPQLASAIELSFLLALQEFLLPLRKEIFKKRKYKPEDLPPFFIPRKEGVENDKELLRDYLAIFNKELMCGAGFTPHISVLPIREFQGFNCLGRAAAFGALLRKQGFSVRFVRSADHAFVLVELADGEFYLCDPMNNRMLQLQGTFIEHDGYAIYLVPFNEYLLEKFLVVHEFSTGIVNAICDNFSYIKQLRTPKNYDRVNYLAVLKYCGLGFGELIQSVDWTGIQTKYFSDLNAYIEGYKIDWLTECFNIEEMRNRADLGRRFDALVEEVYTATTGEVFNGQSSKAFHRDLLPHMREYRDAVLLKLETGKGLSDEAPQELRTYLHEMRRRIYRHKELTVFILARFRKRLFEEELVTS